MEIKTHPINGITIAEIISDGIIINNAEDGVNLAGSLCYQGFDSIIVNEKNINAEFFNLKNGIAGEILQKFSTYRIRLAIVGDFSASASNSLAAFIYESNKGRQINFVTSTREALQLLSK